MANPNPKGKKFTSANQPANRGRKKSIFGSLEKESQLSLDDIRKVYKNILTAKNFDVLEEVKAKYPTVLTEMTIDMLKQEKLGRLTGRKMIVKTDKGEKMVSERIKSYEMIQYMIDRIYGTPAKIDLAVSGELDVTMESPDEMDRRLEELLAKVCAQT